MLHLSITPRRVAPYVISGATGLHVLTRMRQLSRQPAADVPLYIFLLKNTDVLLALGSASVVIWRITNQKPRQQTPHRTTRAVSADFAVTKPDEPLITGVVHELRQIFTALLLGLGLVRRRAQAGDIQLIPGLVQRLNLVAQRGVEAIDALEPSGSTNGREREYGA